jgi:hypothetical protein
MGHGAKNWRSYWLHKPTRRPSIAQFQKLIRPQSGHVPENMCHRGGFVVREKSGGSSNGDSG